MVNQSVSMNLEQYLKVCDFMRANELSSFSAATSRLIKLGLTYTKVMDEQEQTDLRNSKKAPK